MLGPGLKMCQNFRPESEAADGEHSVHSHLLVHSSWCKLFFTSFLANG